MNSFILLTTNDEFTKNIYMCSPPLPISPKKRFIISPKLNTYKDIRG